MIEGAERAAQEAVDLGHRFQVELALQLHDGRPAVRTARRHAQPRLGGARLSQLDLTSPHGAPFP